jgi:hypothetical protein
MKIYLHAQPVSKNARGWKRVIRLIAAWSSPTLVLKIGCQHPGNGSRTIQHA